MKHGRGRGGKGGDRPPAPGGSARDAEVELAHPVALAILGRGRGAGGLGRADLLVLGARGVTKPQRALLGATANRVSHHAACDVLIVHRR